ncbi:MAG: hypothetical protein LKI82_13755 [Clostridium sp.]|jgi:hypothetical protein|uniref:hypothetical protein n=1 Tax=Clostridium sp. TaxID=1506 RepID=UPI0025C33D0B|nr:hypothetical protein [Clostridium sp.]MCI1871958.1 hypothetical protein [Clostridium sp.]
MSPTFGEKVQTSSTGEEASERGIIWEIEKLEYIGGKLSRKRARIRQLKRNDGFYYL